MSRRDAARIRPRTPTRVPAARRRIAAMRGVGLIEVLIAVVIMSIGFLAAARMQVQGMATSQNAYALSQARYLVLDMAERMRANRAGLRDGLYDGLVTETGTSAPDCLESTDTCSRADIRNADKHAWSLALHPVATGATPLLPSTPSIAATGSVTLDATSGAYDVRVQWAELLQGANAMRSVGVQVLPSSLP